MCLYMADRSKGPILVEPSKVTGSSTISSTNINMTKNTNSTTPNDNVTFGRKVLWGIRDLVIGVFGVGCPNIYGITSKWGETKTFFVILLDEINALEPVSMVKIYAFTIPFMYEVIERYHRRIISLQRN